MIEMKPEPSGLTRNVVQCLDDWGIPLYLSHTVTDINGKERVEAITVAKVDEHYQPIKGTETKFDCDALLLSVGLIPENELSKQIGVKLSPVTKGPVVDNSMQTSVSGVFACGNVAHVHDLVDNVTLEAQTAGAGAAAYINGTLKQTEKIPVLHGEGISYVLPGFIDPGFYEKNTAVCFRVTKTAERVSVLIQKDGETIQKFHRDRITAGEMERIPICHELLQKLAGSREITVSLEVR
ncbi:MAG: hypothetical protein BGN88_07120 [Clostridiales bacterium 43-6]|nr:MAG: hypothetical protein BGN88_07120 [Clostridiales bacterium 43-6]